jgi:hypothetical protein
MPSRPRLLRALQLACTALGLGCGDGGTSAPAASCAHSPEDLVGGWRGRFALRACFAADQRMWIGDSSYELESRSHCTTTRDSCRFECTDLGGGSPYGGGLDVSGDLLRVSSDDCLLGPGACVGVYVREASVTCE